MPEISTDDMKEAHQNLKELLSFTFDKQDFSWKRELYRLVPLCWYEVVGHITDPAGRVFVAVQICENHHIDQIKKPLSRPIPPQDEITLHNIDSLVHYCMERHVGIAIISRKEDARPDAMLRFGSVWSYYEYKDLAGCANTVSDFEKAYALNQENPFDLTIEGTERVTVGTPSNDFFPQYIRDYITKEIQETIPDAAPEFGLMNETQYAVPLSILIRLNVQISQDQAIYIRDRLSWYMPPYLPIRVE